MSVLPLLLLGASLAAAGVIHPIPDPFRWDESFTVKMPQLDDEHRGLFNAILLQVKENTAENLKAASIKFRDHFKLEESQFEQTMSLQYVEEHKAKHNSFLARFDTWTIPVPVSEVIWGKNWLVQHIKNTDHKYIDQLPHHIPTPFAWDDSWEVFYARLDEEHQGLFDLIREVGDHPTSTKALSDLKGKLRAHFDYERGIFCDSKTYADCEGHAAKHDRFFKKVYPVTTPVSAEQVAFASNWLVQHIKNTDFKYKHQLDTYKHEVPRPYVWQPSFSVFYDQLDDEHIGLFAGIKDSVDNPADAGKFAHLKKIMKEHFANEESEFVKIEGFEDWAADHIAKHNTVLKMLDANSVPLNCDFITFVEDWLVQHIKNTDFAYRHKLVADVPEPFTWNESFMVFYQKLDAEHKGLFDCVRDCAENPGDATIIASCKSKLRRHFDYEESEFCSVPTYDCYGHYVKHYNFQTKFQGADIPLAPEVTAFAKNWLVNHIKNTDFAYRGKLFTRRHYVVPDPYVWDKSFFVDIKQMDDEHAGLFDAVRAVEADKSSKAAWDRMLAVFGEHFKNEEAMFTTIADFKAADHKNRHMALTKTVMGAVLPITEEMTEFLKSWLTQHIKNTDFKYKGKMPVVHAIPEPFRWTSFFAVHYPHMDGEHKVLFSCLHEVEQNPGDAGLATSCIKKYEEHFKHEEELMAKSGTYSKEELYIHTNKHNSFMATAHALSIPVNDKWLKFAKNWLSQHIPNSDFKYKNKMPFEIPDPYVWDESFQVFYTRLDNEHKNLFKVLADLKANPNDIDILNINRDTFRDHFDYEQKLFTACGEGCDADAHTKKHDLVFKTLTWVTVPVSTEYIEFAANWLVQHIKNTDFRYRYKLPSSHKVPEPYIWNEEFLVSYPKMDTEHVGLFKGIYEVEMDPSNGEKLDDLKELLREHFFNEEARFCDALDLPWDYCQRHKDKHAKFSETFSKVHAPVPSAELQWAKNWLVQHIKNSDFGYKGQLKHPVPEPYVWDTTFAVDYSRMDSEHSTLFANILAMAQNPNDDGKLQELKDNLKNHFEFEEQRFCAVPNFNCVDHKMKHYKFFVVLEDGKAPISCDIIDWAKNWLTQHIKNTDHQYKLRLGGPDSGADFTGAV